jgi:hypothetical protein
VVAVKISGHDDRHWFSRGLLHPVRWLTGFHLVAVVWRLGLRSDGFPLV